MTRERFIELVGKEQEGLRRFLLALCNGDVALADDLAQDSLVKAYIASGDYVERFKFSTWLFRIAYNTFCDHLRKAKAVDTLESSSAINLDSGDHSDSRFQYQELYEAIEALPPNEKSIILLFYMEEKSIKEIASIMSIPEGTVKSHLSRGHLHIKTKISR